MNRNPKRPSLEIIIGAFSIILLVILVASIDTLTFKKGEPFSFIRTTSSNQQEVMEPPDMTWLFTLALGIFLLVTLFILIVATPKQRRILLITLLGMLVMLIGIMWWITNSNTGSDVFLPTTTIVHTPVAVLTATEPLETQSIVEVFFPQNTSRWFSLLITFSILLLCVAFLWLFLRKRWRKDVPLDNLADIAEQAISDLQTGKDYGNVVINCYARMMDRLNQARGIRRRGNLTPDEFISVLIRARLPQKPVRSLTSMFNSVRYGGKEVEQSDIDQAVFCLNEIIAAIKEEK